MSNTLPVWGKNEALRLMIATLSIIVTSLLMAIAIPGKQASADPRRDDAHDSHARHESDSAIVSTTSGVVRGNVTETYREFSGIPYAAPPVGSLRWRPPEPAQFRGGINEATTPGPRCPQSGNPSESEDCLYLNVWTPIDAHPGSRLPVAVYIHGGAFRSGRGDSFEPISMVTRANMVVVTINYRLGALGFLTLPQLEEADGETSGDYGLLDQVQALRWVRHNIARFGGDRDRVTIAGQSAGGESVCTLLASPPAAGLFSAAIVEAGLSCGQGGRATTQREQASFVDVLGCDSPSGVAVAQCLRSKSAPDVLAAQSAVGSRWYPTAVNPALPFSPPEAFDAGLFNRVPVLIGNNSAEGASFQWSQRPITAESFAADVEATFGADAPEILARYAVSNYPEPEAAGQASAAMKTDVAFSCPMLVNAASLSRWTPTYVFTFRDQTARGTPYGAPQHAAEIAYLWQPIEELTPTQQALAEKMIDYWAEFARSGSPTPSGLPLPQLYSPAVPTELAFDTDGVSIISDMAANHQCDFWYEKYPEWIPEWTFHFGPGNPLRFD
jgi:para-nitrobenzyl esterase